LHEAFFIVIITAVFLIVLIVFSVGNQGIIILAVGVVLNEGVFVVARVAFFLVVILHDQGVVGAVGGRVGVLGVDLGTFEVVIFSLDEVVIIIIFFFGGFFLVLGCILVLGVENLELLVDVLVLELALSLSN